jgi:ADP-ribosylglycohydrolase
LGNDFEETVRKAVMLGGDTDTIAAMSGAVAEAFYGGVPRDMAKQAKLYLLRDPKGEELLAIVEQFRAKYVK